MRNESTEQYKQSATADEICMPSFLSISNSLINYLEANKTFDQHCVKTSEEETKKQKEPNLELSSGIELLQTLNGLLSVHHGGYS